jgi:hypothetical protein
LDELGVLGILEPEFEEVAVENEPKFALAKVEGVAAGIEGVPEGDDAGESPVLEEYGAHV